MIRDNDRLLLGMKKRGFGAGWWNGFGGKLDKGEDLITAAKREVFEEVGITVEEIKPVGIIQFEFVNKPADTLQVHIFEVNKFSGQPAETEEMKPQWFDINAIPFDRMWPDDKFWVPLFLKGEKFTGRFLFGKDDAILEQELDIVVALPDKE